MEPEQPTESPAARRVRRLRILRRVLSALQAEAEQLDGPLPPTLAEQIAATEQMIGKLEEEETQP
jgi:hypothetical protein